MRTQPAETSTATRKPRKRAADAPGPLTPTRGHVAIRMYGQGLGDCFLLALPRANGTAKTRPFWIAIDCGVIPGTPGGAERMKRVVADLRASTTWPDDLPAADDGKARGHLDLLVLTHEHMDHLSSFLASEAAAEWDRIQIDQVWTAWTEKEEGSSGLPAMLKRIRVTQQNALLAAANRALRFGLRETQQTLLERLSFEGTIAVDGGPLGFSQRTSDAFTGGKNRSGAPLVCCEPGEVRPLGETDALAYVLGPPRDQTYLGKPDPTPSRPETYERTATRDDAPADEQGAVRPSTAFGANLAWVVGGASPFNAFAMPLLYGADRAQPAGSADYAGLDLLDSTFPFDRDHRVPLPTAESATDDYGCFDAYFDQVAHWRRIDFDWLESSDEFAIQLGNLTNNSSLVLAIELPPAAPGSERKVLLFVADAMVGNWLSWDTIERWKPVDGARPAQTTPDIDDLLGRAVFYKVGHHGSHNATLKAKGLERMARANDLIAFVPVSPRVAREVKRWCDMPLDRLMDVLAERTGGRVVLGNGNVWPPLEGAALERRREELGVVAAKERLAAMTRERDGQIETLEPECPLWVQIEVPY